MSEPFAIGKIPGGAEVMFRPALANRHGLITGATGTGKTVTLQMMTDRLSAIGVPVFLADVKGDLSGLAASGAPSAKLTSRLEKIGVAQPPFSANPVAFWDVLGKRGFPLRATVTDMGPLLLGRLLDLNPTQQGVLALAFKIADDGGYLLLDFKDLRAMLAYVGNSAKQFRTEYGNISAASIGAIQRGLLELDQQGAESFFGEPMLDVDELLHTDASGRGLVHVLSAEELIHRPKAYATFLLWLLSELYEQLPEVGDVDKPKLVFFFDEAHLLFEDAPDALVDKIEQVVRLIRSKGVGIYFVTQNPADVPETVLGQLGNRVQHALRAFTPRDQKAVRIAAETLRPNPMVDTAASITELAVGEALVSVLDEHGSPTITERVWILPPSSRIGPITDQERATVQESSRKEYGKYVEVIDRESAYEKLTGRTTARTGAATAPGGASATLTRQAPAPPPVAESAPAQEATTPAGPAPTRRRKSEPWADSPPEPPSAPPMSEPPARGSGAGDASDSGFSGALSDFIFGHTGPRGGHHDGVLEAAGRSAARSVGSGIGRAILRGALGSILGGRR
jgi:hypothetical protein